MLRTATNIKLQSMPPQMGAKSGCTANSTGTEAALEARGAAASSKGTSESRYDVVLHECAFAFARGNEWRRCFELFSSTNGAGEFTLSQSSLRSLVRRVGKYVIAGGALYTFMGSTPLDPC